MVANAFQQMTAQTLKTLPTSKSNAIDVVSIEHGLISNKVPVTNPSETQDR